jgi:hypothetical protein
MGKTWLKGLSKAKKDAPQLPRTTEEIQKEYYDLCAKLGSATYNVKFNQRVVDQITSDLSNLDAEAGARSKLDKEQKQSEVKTEAKSE